MMGDSWGPYISNQAQLFPRRLGTGYGWRITVPLVKKIIGIPESLRVLEQKINSHPQLTAEDKINFQAYITKSYGSLTTFNILFKEGKDKFVGSGSDGGDEGSGKQKLTMAEAKAKLGLNEYGK